MDFIDLWIELLDFAENTFTGWLRRERDLNGAS